MFDFSTLLSNAQQQQISTYQNDYNAEDDENSAIAQQPTNSDSDSCDEQLCNNEILRASAPPLGKKSRESVVNTKIEKNIGEPEAKRLRAESTPLPTINTHTIKKEHSIAKKSTSGAVSIEDFNSTNLAALSCSTSTDSSQLALMMAAASGFPLLAALAAANSSNNNNDSFSSLTGSANLNQNSDSADGNSIDTYSGSPQKRARTRITDNQLQILRQYFDINNSPSEDQIKEMNKKAQLPEKVIKHWFRNTLFKVKFYIKLILICIFSGAPTRQRFSIQF